MLGFLQVVEMQDICGSAMMHCCNTVGLLKGNAQLWLQLPMFSSISPGTTQQETALRGL